MPRHEYPHWKPEPGRPVQYAADGLRKPTQPSATDKCCPSTQSRCVTQPRPRSDHARTQPPPPATRTTRATTGIPPASMTTTTLRKYPQPPGSLTPAHHTCCTAHASNPDSQIRSKHWTMHFARINAPIDEVRTRTKVVPDVINSNRRRLSRGEGHRTRRRVWRASIQSGSCRMIVEPIAIWLSGRKLPRSSARSGQTFSILS
jgi:hypothetical protein